MSKKNHSNPFTLSPSDKLFFVSLPRGLEEVEHLLYPIHSRPIHLVLSLYLVVSLHDTRVTWRRAVWHLTTSLSRA